MKNIYKKFIHKDNNLKILDFGSGYVEKGWDNTFEEMLRIPNIDLLDWSLQEDKSYYELNKNQEVFNNYTKIEKIRGLEYYDIIICNCSLYYNCDSDNLDNFPKLFDKLLSYLKKSGKLYIQDYVFEENEKTFGEFYKNLNKNGSLCFPNWGENKSVKERNNLLLEEFIKRGLILKHFETDDETFIYFELEKYDEISSNI